MRYALIIAGGAGTRLWPMSRASLPKQLIPFIQGKSLLRLSYERLDGLIPNEQRFIGSGMAYEETILNALPELSADRFIAEPVGRDTLNAVGLGAAVLFKRDPQAVIGVFTADHLIEPKNEFQKIVGQGYELAERFPNALVTFGIAPTRPATGFGYLELGAVLGGTAWIVNQFKEKPDLSTAKLYCEKGPTRYLWNSGMFVWKASTLLECIKKFEPDSYHGLMQIAEAWETPKKEEVLRAIFPALKKISVDFAVMEPASRDPEFRVAAMPMPLKWLDVGSWPAFAETCPHDAAFNTVAASDALTLDSAHCLIASNDPGHLIAAVGCRDLLIIHTPDATLICRADHAEQIKDVHKQLQEKYGEKYV